MPSLSLGVELALPDAERRGEFMAELRTAFEELARRYSAPSGQDSPAEGETFRFTLACYPTSNQEAK